MTNKKRGFTLIEVLIVLTIITMLAAVVIIAVNPARQFAQARNTQRWAAVNSILNAVHQNMVDNTGIFDFSNCTETAIPSTATNLGDNSPDVGDSDLCGCLVPTYVAELSVDPSKGSYTDCADYDSQYQIYQSATTGRVVVSAPEAEIGDSISVTR